MSELGQKSDQKNPRFDCSIFDFQALVFPIFFMQFDTKSCQNFPQMIMHELLSRFHAQIDYKT